MRVYCGIGDQAGELYDAGGGTQPRRATTAGEQVVPRRHSALPAVTHGAPQPPRPSQPPQQAPRARHSMIPAIPEVSPAAAAAAPRPRAGTAPDQAAAHAAAPAQPQPSRARRSMGGAALRISMPDLADAAALPGSNKSGVAARRVSAVPAPPSWAAQGPSRSAAAPESAQEPDHDDAAPSSGSSGGSGGGNGGAGGGSEPAAQGPYLAYLLDLVLAPTSGWQAGFSSL